VREEDRLCEAIVTKGFPAIIESWKQRAEKAEASLKSAREALGLASKVVKCLCCDRCGPMEEMNVKEDDFEGHITTYDKLPCNLLEKKLAALECVPDNTEECKKKHGENTYISVCCNAPCEMVGPVPDFLGDNKPAIGTCYYKCTKCGKACNWREQ